MRKVLTLLGLALLVSAALIVPAAAARGGKPAVPGLKVTVETVDVAIGAWLPWIDAIGDKVVYRVSVTNPGESAAITSVGDSLGTGLRCVTAGGCVGDLGSDLTYVYESSSPHEVTDLEYAGDELMNTVTVAAAGRPDVTVTSETTIQHYLDCADNLNGGQYDPNAYPNRVCRWVPGESGLWSIRLTPDGPGPLQVLLTLRDHIPGNWCVTPDGSGGAVQVKRWRNGDVELLVYLPDNGVCLQGGHGGELFGDGNPSHFYLYFSVPGSIVALKIG